MEGPAARRWFKQPWTIGWRNPCSGLHQAPGPKGCSLQSPAASATPGSARKSYMAFELLLPGLLAGLELGGKYLGSQQCLGLSVFPAGAACARGCPAGRQAPQACVGGGRTRSLQIPGASCGSPWLRMENATWGLHNPSCCNPQSWHHQGQKVCRAASELILVCLPWEQGGASGAIEAHKKQPKTFHLLPYFFVTDHLAARASWELGPSNNAELWGSAKCSVCMKLPKC